MKKLYESPFMKVHKFQPILMEDASKATGGIGGAGEIGWGPGTPGAPNNPDSKHNDVWEDW